MNGLICLHFLPSLDATFLEFFYNLTAINRLCVLQTQIGNTENFVIPELNLVALVVSNVVDIINPVLMVNLYLDDSS